MLVFTKLFSPGMVFVLTVVPKLSSAAISTGPLNVPILNLTIRSGTGRSIRIPCGENCNARSGAVEVTDHWGHPAARSQKPPA